jgi:hypothetical protein
MSKLVLLLLLGALAYYGWQWIGPLPDSAAEQYVSICKQSIPNGETACRCIASTLQDETSKFSVQGLWSSREASQDQAQARILRKHGVTCLSETEQFYLNCINDPASPARGARSIAYCQCTNASIVRQFPSLLKMAERMAETNKTRLSSELSKTLMNEYTGALKHCRSSR